MSKQKLWALIEAYRTSGGSEEHHARKELLDAALDEALAQPEQAPDYAYPTIEDYEEIVGFKVNDAFKMGWAMARTTNDLFAQMTNQMEQS